MDIKQDDNLFDIINFLCFRESHAMENTSYNMVYDDPVLSKQIYMDKIELIMRYDPEIGIYVKKHIYTGEIHGEELLDIFELVGSKLFSKTANEIAKKAAIGEIRITLTDSRGRPINQ